jgi:FHS family L-fucose permease-like MFS transporter
MASFGGGETYTAPVSDQKANYTVPLTLMISLFFMFGFITVLNDILIPHLKGLFKLTTLQAMLVQFCFFGAYFIMSIPAGWIIGKIGYKKGLMLALSVVATGLLLFVPASIFIYYPFFLFALFVVGSGITVLQVAANPYIGALGSPETASTRLNLAGGFNSLATTIGPVIGSALIFINESASDEAKAQAVRIPYVGLAIFAFLIALAINFSKLPELAGLGGGTKDADEADNGKGAWGYQHLVLGALGIFFYVGAEVAIGSILIDYLSQPFMGGLKHDEAAKYVSLYWGGAMVGRFIGFVVLQKIKAEKGLVFVSSAAILLIAIGITVPGSIGMWAIVAIGLFNSVMWPCIFPLSLAGLGKYTSQGSGILVMMVVGGALIPLLQGFLADKIGYQSSFIIVLFCYAYLLFFGLKGHKIVNV